MYAANEEGVLNASVEFDDKTLRPTYRLIVGLAGSSSGLDIARRFGIPAGVVGNAAAQVVDSSRNATEYLRRIKREAEEATSLRAALEEERAAVAEKFAALDKEAERREAARQTTFELALQKATGEFEKHARELLTLIEDRTERIKIEREAQKHAAELKREAKRAATGARGERGGLPANETPARGVRVVREGKVLDPLSGPAAREVAEEVVTEYVAARLEGGRDARGPSVGDRVRLKTFGSIGIVDRVKGEEAEVRVGSLRMREKLDNLELLEAAPAKTAVAKDEGKRAALQRSALGTEFKREATDAGARSELNVIGRSTDEAVDAVDKFLDEAFLNSLSEVRIVHGHGTGALRRVISELLQGHPHVARFSPAPPNQGGAGATIVELKQ
jgi:DNA mismatch repair protein MutS2